MNLPKRGESTSHRQHRQSIRLREYDYAQAGAYFITICTHNSVNLFGSVVAGLQPALSGEMQVNTFGKVVQTCWEELPAHYPHVQLDAFVVMPNHVHGIVVLVEDSVGEGSKPALATTRKRHGLPEIVRAFKTFSARRINQLYNSLGTPVWQRNYYEHVIRDLSALNRVQEYIHTNPLRWDMDRENPYQKREDVFDLWLKSFHGRSTKERQ